MGASRKTTVLFGLEPLEGIAVSRATLSSLAVLARPTASPDFGAIERELASPYMTPALQMEGLDSGTFNFMAELQGPASGVAGVVPPFDGPLRAAGFRRVSTKRATIGAITNGPIAHGSHFDQTTSNAEGFIIGRGVNGDSHIFLWQAPWDVNVLSATGALTFDVDGEGTAYGSAPTVTPSAMTNAVSYFPCSTPLMSIDIDGVTNGNLSQGVLIEQAHADGTTARGRVHLPFGTASVGDLANTVYFEHFPGTPRFDVSENGGDIDVTGTAITLQIGSGKLHQPHGGVSASMRFNFDGVELGLFGARGAPTLKLTNGDRGILEFEWQGASANYGDQDPPAFAGDGATPPKVAGGTYLLGTSYTPRFAECSISAGVELALRQDPSKAGGYLGATTVNRKPTITLDPEIVAEAVFDMFGKADAKGSFRSQFSLGGGTANGNNFRVEGWQTQVGSAAPGDRSGLNTVDGTLVLTGNGDDELVLHCW